VRALAALLERGGVERFAEAAGLEIADAAVAGWKPALRHRHVSRA
jgi:hypothetical protein